MASGTRSSLSGLGPGPGSELDTQSETEDPVVQKLVKYVQDKAKLYKEDELMDHDLWEIYQDEFKPFTLHKSKKVHARALLNLRNSLISRGVFVEKNQRIKLAQVLYNTSQEEEQHQ